MPYLHDAYTFSLIHSRAYDTDLGLKSGRVRQLNCRSPSLPRLLQRKSDACLEQDLTIAIWLPCGGVRIVVPARGWILSRGLMVWGNEW